MVQRESPGMRQSRMYSLWLSAPRRERPGAAAGSLRRRLAQAVSRLLRR
jgi:hypothetical protein